jgi:hypothetical protein
MEKSASDQWGISAVASVPTRCWRHAVRIRGMPSGVPQDGQSPAVADLDATAAAEAGHARQCLR